MQLAGRLRTTTLGDLLGTLYRDQATGNLELVEDSGRTHRIFLTRGLVVAVDIDGASVRLAEILRAARAADEDVLRRSLLRAMASSRLHGQVLIEEFHLAPSVVGDALRRQILGRLARLEELADARVCFRVAVRPPRSALGSSPLTPREFLAGRRRARARAGTPAAFRGESGPPSAWETLGLSPGASLLEIKRAYRQLARTVHPDLHPGASEAERRVLELRFMEITCAYGTLVA